MTENKYSIKQAFVDGTSGFLLFWVVFFLAVGLLRGCADEQAANELKAKQNMYVRVQVEGAN
ncbi:hypothetical protein [Acinetobacter baumannii]|uniref:Uncharacterized protein n=1 Tax=Acinetobacter baumannii 1499986 TaxID=1310673 RepID=A0A836LYG7_ACIBA|nr:hypothetical protein [Acinetobacter baumannii]EXC36271.1 hypothetical protein J552_3825 [Acinetobacter baumannii 951631]EXG10572.1 hypothetical protein J712_2393 [Acinetobacter baumannii 722310]EXI01461.1 hypothetical protein J618_1467 [Acinetobacter baumannii 607805]EXI04915.1 hypothetical protein J639_1607 [Acinetobacter baumannii 457946]EXQ92603.1 hypothetical protein J681_1522 [Acinetobacter baumannii 1170863]